MLHTIYLELETKLQSINTALANAGLQQIQHIAPFNDQYNMMKEELAFKRPAVFVQFAESEWKDESQLVQRGPLIIRLHICMERYAEGFRGSRDQGKYLELFHLPQLIYAGMQGLSGTNFKNMSRVKQQSSAAHDAIFVHTMDFQCLAEDRSAYVLKDFVENDGSAEVAVTVDWSLV